MRIIPVIDVMGGRVVRAVGGRRSEYRPIRSMLTDSTDPVEVAEALMRVSGADELYVADLDRLTGGPPAVETVRAISRRFPQHLLDGGIRHPADAVPYLEAGVDELVLGTETLAGPETIRELFRAFDVGEAVLSLDLFDGRLFGDLLAWGLGCNPTPIDLIGTAREMGIWRVILLDLSRVGSGSGAGSEALCRQIKQRYRDVSVIAGGGVRNWDDIRRLEDAGADGVLVASALHDGTLTFPRPTS